MAPAQYGTHILGFFSVSIAFLFSSPISTVALGYQYYSMNTYFLLAPSTHKLVRLPHPARMTHGRVLCGVQSSLPASPTMQTHSESLSFMIKSFFSASLTHISRVVFLSSLPASTRHTRWLQTFLNFLLARLFRHTRSPQVFLPQPLLSEILNVVLVEMFVLLDLFSFLFGELIVGIDVGVSLHLFENCSKICKVDIITWHRSDRINPDCVKSNDNSEATATPITRQRPQSQPHPRKKPRPQPRPHRR